MKQQNMRFYFIRIFILSLIFSLPVTAALGSLNFDLFSLKASGSFVSENSPFEFKRNPLANKTWDGGGATENWSDAANWSDDTIPNFNDRVVFDGTSAKNATIDQSITVGAIEMLSGYTGVITQAAGASVNLGSQGTLSNSFFQESGVFNCSSASLTFSSHFYLKNGGTFNAGAGTLIINGLFNQSGGTFNGSTGDVDWNGRISGSFTLAGGTFNAPSGTLFLNSSFVDDGGVFNHNNGSVIFDSTHGANITNSHPFNNLNFNSGQNFVGSLVVLGTLNLNAGSINTGVIGIIEARGAVNVSPNFDGNSLCFTCSAASLRLANGGGARTITFASGTRLPKIDLDDPQVTIETTGSGTILWQTLQLRQGVINQGSTAFNFSDKDTSNVFNQSGGTFNAGSQTITITTRFAMTGGIFNGSTGIMDFNGGQHNSNFTLSGGTFLAPSSTMLFDGSFQHDANGTFLHNNGTVTFENNTSSTSHAVSNINPFNNLNLNAGAIFAGALVVEGNLALNTGSLGGGTLNAKGNITIEAAFAGGIGSVTFSGAGNQTYTNNGGANPTRTWTLNKPSGTVILASDLDISNANFGSGLTDFVLTSGTITTGNFTVNAGRRAVTRTNGYIIGKLRRDFDSTGARLFPTGTANGYSPVTANVTVLTINPSSLTVGTIQTPHPQLDPAISLARFWSITETGNLSADLTFKYLQADVSGNEANYKVNRITGGNVEILTPPAATVNTIADTATVTGVTDFAADWTLSATTATLQISPTSASANPGEQVTFTPTGGNAPFAFSLLTNNSGANINSTTGVYTAGSTTGATDTVRLTDSNGSTADATVSVVDPFVVTNTNASGVGSLPQAVLNANAAPGVQTISFNIPGSAPFSIKPTNRIVINEAVVIDGSTQPGFDGTPVIELDGSNMTSSQKIGLHLLGATGGSTIKNLAINRFADGGISVNTGGNKIEGCFIGTNTDGTIALGNKTGIKVNSPDNTIGGTTAAARNVISGNLERGIEIFDNNTIVQGNYIGTAADGVSPLGNAAGILIGTNAANNTIGGTTAGEANVIAFNDGQVSASFGVRVSHLAGNSIRGNSIHSNGNLGIDLGTPGVTPNDACDADTGANDLQNFPVITSAGTFNGSTQIQGTLDSQPNQTYTIDFYASAAADPSGNGEGQIYLGSTIVTTDANCSASFNVSLNASVTVSQVITATATDAAGSTSEFSAAFALSDLSPFVVTNTSDGGDGSLRQAIINANNTPGTQTIQFNISGTPPFTINTASRLTVTQPVIIDATTQPGFAGSPLVEIRRSGDAIGLNISSNITVKGLIINGFTTNLVLCGSNIVVQGNYIGTDASGSSAAPGNGTGIFVCGGSNNLIGGSAPGQRNLISGNSTGIVLRGSNNVIRGNYIGTNAAGTAGIAEFSVTSGIELIGNGNTIADNVISNHVHGLDVKMENFFANSLSSNLVENNIIGLSADGTTVIRNVTGVYVSYSSRNVRLTRNRIFGNTSGGISLNHSFLSANDPQDPDDGPNLLQNHPVLNGAVSSGGATTITGTLNSTPSRTFTIEFFSSPSCDLSGAGQGETFIGSENFTTDAGGNTEFSVSLPVTIANGRFITATAADTSGDTSGFSRCRIVSQQFVVEGRLTDASNAPLPNTPVRITEQRGSGQTLQLNLMSDSLGKYSYPFAAAGSNVTITPARPGFAFTPASRSLNDLSANQSSQNFSGAPSNLTIRGSVQSLFNGTTAALGGVTLTLTNGRTTQTDVNGNYVFHNVAAGSHTLTPSKANYSFAPSSVEFTLNANQTFDFTAQLSLPLAGRVAYFDGSGIGVMNADGSAAVRLINRANHPSISPDGSKIAYSKSVAVTRNGETRSVPKIFTANFDGTNQQMISPSPLSFAADQNPVWSPDGSKLAFTRKVSAALSQVVAYNFAAHTETLITQQSSATISISFRELSWSPDGTKIAVCVGAVNSSEIRIANADGSHANVQAAALPLIAAQAGEPAYSPDGSKIAFIKYPSAVSVTVGQIWTANPDGSGAGVLPNADQPAFRKADWSPDGAYLIYERGTSSAGTFGVISEDGTTAASLGNRNGRENFDWGRAFSPLTPAGANVGVSAGATNVTFSNVSGGGQTTVIPIPPNSAGTTPGGFVVGQFGAYEISTTASFTAPITVCFTVPPVPQSVFNQITILHRENGLLVPKPTTRIFNARQVCAVVSSLSPFVLAEQIDTSLPSISGLANDAAGSPLSNIEIKLTGTENRTTVTDSGGLFSFPNLTTGESYNVQPKQVGYLFTEYSQDFVNLAGENTVLFTGAPQNLQISGRVLDGNGNGVSGVAIVLDGAKSDEVTTGAGGNYSFTDLPADGSFSLTPSNGANSFSPQQIFVDALTNNLAELNFTQFAPTAATAGVSGRVMTKGGRGAAKARVTLTGANGETRMFITNPFGYYRFPDVEVGRTYVISVSSKQYRFQPRVITVTEEMENVDFMQLE